ncbi:hypothetical protein ADK76_09625 [Streptomyces griseoflavus]|uniref:hypothetical protein n=1 Tax=Streptomyces rimosus TaxID=1927 RepID=UPI0004C7871E|nr:hypothetical protein [Streptomyces rimosus]KOG64376.1 hypothetical protein ADK76_09625 [Streptomyces griseoflavus]
MNRQPITIPESRAAQPPPGGLRESDHTAGTRPGALFARSLAATSWFARSLAAMSWSPEARIGTP